MCFVLPTKAHWAEQAWAGVVLEPGRELALDPRARELNGFQENKLVGLAAVISTYTRILHKASLKELVLWRQRASLVGLRPCPCYRPLKRCFLPHNENKIYTQRLGMWLSGRALSYQCKGLSSVPALPPLAPTRIYTHPFGVRCRFSHQHLHTLRMSPPMP